MVASTGCLLFPRRILGSKEPMLDPSADLACDAVRWIRLVDEAMDGRNIVEPFNLRCWKVSVAGKREAVFYTCARPGRSLGPDAQVDDETVSTWVKGLPSPSTAIISLLGRKGNTRGVSEFTFYSFCGGTDGPSERKCRMTFLEWLEHHHKDRGIVLREHPTIDHYAHSYQSIHPY